MSLETEKIFTLLNKFLDEHGDEYQDEEKAVAAFQMQYNQRLRMEWILSMIRMKIYYGIC